MKEQKTKKEKMLDVMESIITKAEGEKRVTDGDLFEWYRQRLESLRDIRTVIKES